MKKVVIKIGRTIATSKRNKIDEYRFEQLAKQIQFLRENGIAVIFVVSAAISCGEHQLGLNNSYDLSKSLVAGVGQAAVTYELYRIFRKHNITVGQLLLTKHDLEGVKKRTTIAAVIHQAVEQNIVLIANENDIAELNSFEGNDYLATELAKLMNADHLLLLTDVDGVLDQQHAVIKHYEKQKKIADISPKNRGSVGGIKTKLDAAIQAAKYGITTWISSGKTQNILTRMFLDNEHIGTRIAGENI